MISLYKNTPLFKSISEPYSRHSIFDYELFKTENKRCNAISWLALTNEKADYYKKKSKTATVYTYAIKKKSNFLVTNYLNKLDIKNTKDLRVIYKESLYSLPKKMQPHFSKYNYMNMTLIERIDYEYKFAFGHIDVIEQRNFLKLIMKLEEYGLILPTVKMHGSNIFKADKQMLRIIRASITLDGKFRKNMKNQRFSLYTIDINIVNNLCILYPNINGYFYISQPSVWHNKMKDTSEIAIFNPKNIIK
jgi:hypothetical protein